MAEALAPHPAVSVETYLELEKDADVRHDECVGGRLYAMTGTSRRHNTIAFNIARKLADAAEGTPCRVYMSDVKVRTPDDAFYYPDVIAACEPEPDDPYVEHQPCLLVEVVSPSTESIDRREKLAAYKKIPPVKSYLIVD
ncbi:MAG TPA: Uma2 family endonuclease [Thermomicrobiales bacterium]|nr:Uma2 family endonuclease [Thermomicrobiales bacterium]